LGLYFSFSPIFHSPPFAKIQQIILYSGEVIDWGVKSRILEKMGAWYAYQGNQIGQGREKTKAYLEEHPEVAQEIETAIREKLLKGEVLEEGEVEQNEEDKGSSE
jgi:recombination protein RecA